LSDQTLRQARWSGCLLTASHGTNTQPAFICFVRCPNRAPRSGRLPRRSGLRSVLRRSGSHSALRIVLCDNRQCRVAIELLKGLTAANGGPHWTRMRTMPVLYGLISGSQWNDGFGPDSCPSRGGRCRRASRPTEASKACACYVRFTSIPAGRNAQIALKNSA
jgi:hypothetical protein